MIKPLRYSGTQGHLAQCARSLINAQADLEIKHEEDCPALIWAARLRELSSYPKPSIRWANTATANRLTRWLSGNTVIPVPVLMSH